MTHRHIPHFRGRRPPQLAFGTSGLRGLVADLTDIEAWVNTRGFLEFLCVSGAVERGSWVAVGGDLRPSTGRILRAVCRGIVDSGFRVFHAGRVPTPALAAFALEAGWSSAMVTGSHIPFDRNGIKFYKPDGEVLKADEPSIMEAVEEVRSQAYEEAPESSVFDDSGMLRPDAHPPLLTVDDSVRKAYLHRYLSFFGPRALTGLRVAVYQHSAVSRDLFVQVLERLGAQVATAGRSERFVPVDTEAVDEAMVQDIARRAEKARVELGGLDAIVSTDGDGDRPLLLAVDAAGTASFVRGDTLGAMVCEDLDADGVAVPVSASDLVDRHLQHLGVHLVRTRIGSPWVIEALGNLEGVRKMGFEANGGFMLESGVERGPRRLSPLPTRDAFLPVLTVLETSVRTGESVLARVARLPQRFTYASLLDAVEPSVSRKALEGLRPAGVEEAWYAHSDVRYRAEGAEPRSADSDRETSLRKVAGRIETTFESLAVGRLQHANWLDGVRMSFDRGDIVHLRASGNAPQFRVYVTAERMERARQLATDAIAPGGVVASLLEGGPSTCEA